MVGKCFNKEKEANHRSLIRLKPWIYMKVKESNSTVKTRVRNGVRWVFILCYSIAIDDLPRNSQHCWRSPTVDVRIRRNTYFTEAESSDCSRSQVREEYRTPFTERIRIGRGRKSRERFHEFSRLRSTPTSVSRSRVSVQSLKGMDFINFIAGRTTPSGVESFSSSVGVVRDFRYLTRINPFDFHSDALLEDTFNVAPIECHRSPSTMQIFRDISVLGVESRIVPQKMQENQIEGERYGKSGLEKPIRSVQLIVGIERIWRQKFTSSVYGSSRIEQKKEQSAIVL